MKALVLIFFLASSIAWSATSGPFAPTSVAEILSRPASSLVDYGIGDSYYESGLTVAEILRRVQPPYGSWSTVRDLVTSDFYQRYLTLSSPFGQRTVDRLRETLMEVGIPLNLMPSELAAFEANPNDPLFSMVSSHTEFTKPMINRLKSGGMFYIIDVVKKLKENTLSQTPGIAQHTERKVIDAVARILQPNNIDLRGLALSDDVKDELALVHLDDSIHANQLSPAFSLKTVLEVALADLARQNPGPCAETLKAALDEIRKLQNRAKTRSP